MRVLGIDPGGRTGLCLVDTENYTVEYPEDGVLGPDDHHNALYSLCLSTRADVLACERFDYRRQLNYADLISVEYIGILKMLVQDVPNKELVLQTQLKGKKGLWTDDKLKALDLYAAGKDLKHRNDATRQALFYVTSTLRDMYWIEEYGNTQV